MEELAEYCVGELEGKVDVKEENVSSLLHLLVHYERFHFVTLKDNVQKFMALKWKALTESGHIHQILQDEKFTAIGVEAVCKYHALIK